MPRRVEQVEFKGLRPLLSFSQGIAEEEALKKGLEEKAVQFVKGGAEIYKQA